MTGFGTAGVPSFEVPGSALRLITNPVIPAEAGICEKSWIPIFVGMTSGQDVCLSYMWLRNISE